MRTQFRGRTALMAAAAVASMSMTVAACGGGDSASDSKSVTIWSSLDPPVQAGLEKWLTPKAKAKGITIKWSSVDDINSLIMTKIQANDTPDIAFIPQPGVVANVVKRGAAHPLDDVVDMSALQSSMVPGTLEAGTVDDKLYGLLVSMNVKSLVFYNKKAWDAAGYKAPQSIDELNALTDQIKSDGNTPWCMGIEDGAATGWAATDWFEDLVMRYGGADGYNSWVTHETPFDSDFVKEAGAEFEKLMFTDGNVLGGRDAITSTNFGTAGNPMFDKDPGCWMYKQGSFITGFFPKDVTSDLDANVGVFGFPPAQAGAENPVLGGGDLAMLLSDKSAAADVVKLMSETDFGSEAAPSSSFISPHKDFDASLYPNALTKNYADVAYSSTQFLFDGSDQMPGEVGAGSFWKEMTSWISGQEDLDQALANIDASWPQQ
jgi:ABC-type glycerol-3-phosphate transport system substrate-binding protein